MTLRCLEPLALKFDGRTVQFEPGSVFTVTPAQGARVLAHFPGKVEALDLPTDPPVEPLLAGWLIAYRDRAGRLVGGTDDRAHGTVADCRWDGATWIVALTNGQQLRLSAVVSVGQTDDEGRVVAAWTTRGAWF